MIGRESLIQKTGLMFKFSRIYSRVLLQSLLTHLYFMNFDWLPFVKAFCDWPVQIVSGSFGGLLTWVFTLWTSVHVPFTHFLSHACPVVIVH